jgi:hypothetical protein
MRPDCPSEERAIREALHCPASHERINPGDKSVEFPAYTVGHANLMSIRALEPVGLYGGAGELAISAE